MHILRSSYALNILALIGLKIFTFFGFIPPSTVYLNVRTQKLLVHIVINSLYGATALLLLLSPR